MTTTLSFDFNEWQRAQREHLDVLTFAPDLLPRLECLDGFSMSVQASDRHYCTPRKSRAPSYTHVEVYVEERDLPDAPELLPYRSKHGQCGWVPVEVVNAVVLLHGGLK